MKALWQISLEEWVPYDKNVHLRDAWKFLYWEERDGKNEEILLVGWPKKLIEIRDMVHRDLWQIEIAPERRPNGAGTMFLTKIENWWSEGLDLTTPDELRARIMELLGAES